MSVNLTNFQASVEYLYGLQRHGIKLGLDNSRKLMDMLGEPQRSFRSVHIAGTNGKGSTAKAIASILQSNGLKVGLYSSPHLVSFTERIRINNSPITESEVISLTSHIRGMLSGKAIQPTFFEFVTAMAFYYFAREKVDWAIVEVGMGGRLDATNVLLPDVSVITNIGIEHTEFLGESLRDIAKEKAGIIKPSTPLVTATNRLEALNILEKTAQACSAEMHLFGREFKGTLVFMDSEHIVFDYKGLKPPYTQPLIYSEYHKLSIPASGKYQLYNASLALRVCEILAQRGFPVSEQSMRHGLSQLHFEGRLELISSMPPLIIDSAHNPDASHALAETLKQVFPSRKIILIAGMMKDKDIPGILKPLIQITDTIIVTKPKGERAAPPEKLDQTITLLASEGNINTHSLSVSKTQSVAEAVKLAQRLWQEDAIILVTGSFYTTGEVKELFSAPAGALSQLRE
jgi:dihydrofolate synthase/folylpolyglutamate synthase